MGSMVSLEECTSTDNPRVRDCCHLEGETPVEIRIAYQHPRSSAQPAGFDPSAIRAHQATASWERGPLGDHGGFQRHAGGVGEPWPMPVADAEKPPMPRGAERLRLPPPAGSGGRSQAGCGEAGGDFDADTFAAPPDSERSEVGPSPGRMLQPAALQMLELPDDGFFPEVIRASRQGTHTFREASSTSRDTHRDTQRDAKEVASPGSPSVPSAPSPPSAAASLAAGPRSPCTP